MNRNTRHNMKKKAAAIALCLSAVTMMMPAAALAAPTQFADCIHSEAISYAKDEGADTTKIYVAKVNEYLSVFEEKSVSSYLVGRLYRGAAAFVVKEEGGWSYITSGSVAGWVCSSYLVTGEDAEELLDEINPRVANTTACVLNVRSEADIDSPIIMKVEEGTELVITGSTEDWWRVRLTNDTIGYISKDFADVEKGLYTAVPRGQEKDRAADISNRRGDNDQDEEEWEEPETEAPAKAEKKSQVKTEKKSETKTQTKSESKAETKARQAVEDEDDDEEEPETKSGSESGWVSLGEFKTTAYCTCSKCNGSNAGKTATGATPVVGTTVAVDKSVIPLGSKLMIDGHVYIAQDTGVKGKTVDILHSSHSGCYDYGVRYKEVFIMK